MRMEKFIKHFAVMIIVLLSFLNVAFADNTFDIYCTKYLKLTDNGKVYKIEREWLKISFKHKLIWKTEIDNKFNPEDLTYNPPNKKNMFGIVAENESRFEIIDYSPLDFNTDYFNTENFFLSHDAATHIVKNILKKRQNEHIQLISSKKAKEVLYAYNNFNECIRYRCDLDHRLRVLKYRRTRNVGKLSAWRFYKTEKKGKTAMIPDKLYGFFEQPYKVDTYDLYWAYLIGDSDRMYDPTDYNEWWTFVQYYEYELSVPDKSYTFYCTDRIPESVADFYNICKYGVFDTAK